MSIERQPSDLGSFSEAVAHDGPGRTIHVSGMIGFDPDGKLVEGGIAAETAATFDTIEAILGRAGAGLSDLVRMNVFMLDLAEYGEFSRVRAERFGDQLPASAAVAGLRAAARGADRDRRDRVRGRGRMTAAGATMPGRGAQMRVAWTPTPEAIEHANVTRLMRRHGLAGLGELHERSLEPEWLWPALIEDLGIELARPYERIVDLADGPERARWFEGAELNLAGACLDRWAALDERREALGWHTELGDDRRLDFGELTRLADGAAAALTSLGVGRGDTVGLFMPLAPETVAALHGCWKIGAIAVPIFSGFGADALARRLQDSGARVLVTVDGFPRRGSVVEAKAIADRALADAPGVERVLVWRRLGLADVPWDDGRDVDWNEAVPHDPPPATQPVPADHPALLIYTSGSTGRPKGAVLTHAGMLLTIAKDAAYHVDLHADDRLCWVTDLGWIMGAWEIVAAGSLGAYACMIEGAPATPADRLWSLIAEHEISVVGVSPSLIRGLAAAGAAPGPEHDLSSLRILAATGEPWSPAAYDWLADEVGGGRCPVINISGGSEVCGCLLAPTPVGELETCSLGGPALGMDVAVFGDDGEPLGPDQVGELVCRRAVAGDDEEPLERRRALHRDLLVAVSRRLGARRLGELRRARAVVPARTLRRHAQRRRPADRPGRGRGGADRARRGRRGGDDRDAAPGQGRGDVVLRRPGRRLARRGGARRRRRRGARQAVPPRPGDRG